MTKPFTLVIAFVLLALSCGTASAQLCGSYGVTLAIHDSTLLPVTAYAIKIEPLGKDELGGALFKPGENEAGTAELKLPEGRQVSDAYRVTISAAGFQPAVKIFRFPHCVWLIYDVQLLRPGQPKDLVTGKFTDDTGTAVPFAGATFIAADKTERFVNADSKGIFEIKLAPGVYTVETAIGYHHITRVENFMVPPSGPAKLDLKLKKHNYNEDKQVILQTAPSVN
ncbi:MAG: carboxypeptidase-like regulatory domain-containing protein [Pyrinomonadaceae bacterium]